MEKNKTQLSFFVIAICLFFLTNRGLSQGSTSKVQQLLSEIAERQPEKVTYILETKRWYLNNPRMGYLVPTDEAKLKAAFLEDISSLTKIYAWKYLLDWKLIVAKAARETFWGSSFLCNRANNYFGIRTKSKPWACSIFNYCDGVVRNDPYPASFIVFPDYEASLWMFVHTIFSAHFRARYSDDGARIIDAIAFERRYGIHYWQAHGLIQQYSGQLNAKAYTAIETAKTWSGYKANNLCVACDVTSDLDWVNQVEQTLSSQ